MSVTPKTQALESWFHANDGYLYEGIKVLHNETAGYHLRAEASIPPGTNIASAPHSLTLSYLNALVDDKFPVFAEQRSKFKIEAIGFFYLMTQYVHRNESFWKPYLDVLPQPEDDFSQPLFFESEDDIAWLEGTDVWHTVTARRDVYKEYHRKGIAVLQDAGIDVPPYTWHLFKWATAVFAARSFTSLSLISIGSKYRTAYKSDPDGRRQPVLLDMSTSPPEDDDFPVLFPGLDAANHSHEVRVDWTFNPGHFSIRINNEIPPGVEVFNNYGPKGNGELLIGYGFCIPNNPYDTVALTLKEPPADLQVDLKHVKAGYFTAEGAWSLEKGTFRLGIPSPRSQHPHGVFFDLPELLLELLLYMLRCERDLPFIFIERLSERLTTPHSSESRYLPHIARLIATFLSQKLTQLESGKLPSSPQNTKQRQASIYRQGQIKIMQMYISNLQSFVRSLIWTPLTQDSRLAQQPCLVTLESALSAFAARGLLDDAFMEGISLSTNTRDLEQLRIAGWEEDVWVMLWSYVLLFSKRYSKSLNGVFPEYIDLDHVLDDASVTTGHEAISQAADLLGIVATAAAACPDCTWGDDRWSAKYIASVGGRILEHESFMIRSIASQGDEEAGLHVYLHSSNSS